MTAPTKTRTSIWSGQSISAGTAAPPGGTNSSWIDLSTTFESQLDIKITNGATGPTVGVSIIVEAAADYNAGAPTLPIFFGGALIAGVSNSEVDYFTITVPMGVAAIRLCAGGNTGQAVTVDADISRVTAIS